MAAVTAAVVVAAGTAYAANRSSASARNAQRSADRNAARQDELDRERLGFSREQYDDWKERFNPVWDRMSALAMEEEKPDYAQITADVGGAPGESRPTTSSSMPANARKATSSSNQYSRATYRIRLTQ